MLRTIETLSSYQLDGTDGPIGHVHDFYFDDEHWTLRYLVVDTGRWLPGRKVLVSPMAITAVNWNRRSIVTTLTRAQIRNGPAVDAAEPVSRKYEAAFNAYYGYPYYWAGPGVWADAAYPAELAREAAQRARPDVRLEDPESSHLRSANEVAGYHIQALDKKVGHVEDFVLDDETWVIRYLVIDTSNWLGGRLVLVAAEWIDRINWHLSEVHVRVTGDDVKQSPEFNVASLNRTFEERLLSHYAHSMRRRQQESKAAAQ
jgi:sporulation protein YlmC with PRC-barrel domain